MKYNYIIFLILISCRQEKDLDVVVRNNQPNLSWLVGEWQRVDEEPGRMTFESWYPSHTGHFNGFGYTLQENDTVFKETLKIRPQNKDSKGIDGPWVLQVTGVNDLPTLFKMEQHKVNSFTAVNIENEFPTHIKYSFSNDTLKAVVSNQEMAIDFKFVKQ